jgi:hypothetical protein
MQKEATVPKYSFYDIIDAITVLGCTSSKVLKGSFSYDFPTLMGPGRIHFRGEDEITLKKYDLNAVTFILVGHREKGIASPDNDAMGMYCEQQLVFRCEELYVLQGKTEIKDRDKAIKLICSATGLNPRGVEAATSNENQFHRLITVESSPLSRLLDIALHCPEQPKQTCSKGLRVD